MNNIYIVCIYYLLFWSKMQFNKAELEQTCKTALRFETYEFFIDSISKISFGNPTKNGVKRADFNVQ